MSELLEGSIDDVLAEASSATSEEPPPRVLVEYRNRGVPPAVFGTVVILCAALGITQHRRLTPPHPATAHAAREGPGAVLTEPPAKPASAESAVAALEPPPVPTVSEVEVPFPAAREPEAPPTVEPPAVAEVSAPPPAEPAVVAAVPLPDHPPANRDPSVMPRVDPEPEPDPQPSAEEVEREILREAAQKEADLEEMGRLKPAIRRKSELEAPQRTYDQRIAFREELRKILKTKKGPAAGRAIKDLIEQNGHELDHDHHQFVKSRLKRLIRPTPAARVALMRACDVPESIILDELFRDVNRHDRNTRGGVRTLDEAREKAAYLLFSLPAPTPPHLAPTDR